MPIQQRTGIYVSLNPVKGNVYTEKLARGWFAGSGPEMSVPEML